MMLIGSVSLSAQPLEKVSLSLRNVVDMAITQSSAVKYAQNTNVNYYWRWQNHQTRFRPQLTLSGDIPDFNKQDIPVRQDDGSIKFHYVNELSASANLALSQSIPQLGMNIYAASSLYGLQDFNNQQLSFSGKPIYIGFTQPILAYNWMKWAKMTEPLIYEEAQRNFVESIEEIAFNAVNLFFRYLRIQTNFILAESNLKNSRDNLKIAEVRQKLGTISENDFSRIQLSVFNAQKALNSARMDLKNADFELKKYIGLDQEQAIDLEVPLDMLLFVIDPDEALGYALEHRKETPQYERRLIEADRDLTQAKRSTGLSATLRMSYGLSNSSEMIGGVYNHPEQQQQVRLSMSIPILDWGRSESQVKLAESRRELVIYDVEKDRQDFERGVVVMVEQFNLIKTQLETAKAADEVAEEGYLIALKKFQNGEISITDLNISLAEREAARRDYIRSIEEYWESLYRIRIYTLYDFELDEKLSYGNPMLADQD